MKSLLQKFIILLVLVSLITSQTMPVLAQENTPEAPTESPTPPTGTPTPENTATETPTPTVTLTNDGTETATPNETLIPSLSPTGEGSLAPTIEIQLRATPETIKPDGKIKIHWEIVGIPEPDVTFTLQFNVPIGFEFTKQEEGTFDTETRTLSMPLSTLSGTFQVQTTTEITEDAVFYLAIVDADGTTLGANQLIVPLREKFEVKKNGGEITARDGELKVKFGPEALKNEDIEVEIGNPAGNGFHSLSGKAFEIKAKTKKDGLPLTQFDERVEFAIDLHAYGIPVEQNDNIHLYWFNPETQAWSGLYSWVDDETNTLHGFTYHFSTFDVGVNNWQASKTPSVESFQVATFTGTATYSLPIQIPAGPGGLQPNLNLNYNSQVVDQSSTLSNPGWVGMGWSLDTGYIDLKRNLGGNDHISYSLTMNGMSSEFFYTPQGWRSTDENFIRAEWLYPATGAIWKIWDKQGNTYEFGFIVKEHLPGGCGATPFRWALTKVTNIYGQTINYNYTKDTKTFPCGEWGEPLTADTALYPETITYAGGRVRVRFVLENRTDFNPNYLTDQLYHHFERTRLDQIIIEQDFNGDTVFESLVRKYDLTYSNMASTNRVWPNIAYPNRESPSTLASITEYGIGGANALPATTFFYEDYMHLTRAENGYGGAVKFTYSPWYASKGYVEYTWQGSNDGYPLLEASSTPYGLMAGTDAVPTKPGGAYYVSTTFYSPKTYWSVAGQVMLNNGTPGPVASAVYTTTASVYSILPPTAGFYLSPKVKVITGPLWASSPKLAALTTIYRVTSKTLIDGNSQDLVYTYTYEGATVNTAKSISVMNSSNTLVSVEPYGARFSQFLGHSKVTITEPDTVTKTIIEYHQTNALKGREFKTTIQVNGISHNSTTFLYSAVNLPGYISGIKGAARYWVKLDAVENYLYNNSGGEVGRTRTDYYYEATYGNLITQNEYTWNGSAWSLYRNTITDYFPLNNTTKYLVSLPAKVKVIDGSGGTLSTTLYLYDSNTGAYNIAPTLGKLTGVRTLLDATLSANNYNQVSYRYDTWGNQDQVTVYNNANNWNANPTTGAQTTTTLYDPTFNTYPIKVTNTLGQFIEMGYDFTKGVPTSLKDLNGNSTSANYDAFGRITSITRVGDASPTLSMSYVDSYPFTTTITLNAVSYQVTKKYDGMGRPIQTISGGTVIDTIYETALMTRQRVPYASGTTPPTSYTTTTYYPALHKTETQAPDLTTTFTVVDGLTTTFTDAKNYTTTSTSDVWGRVKLVTPHIGPTVEYFYTEQNLLWKVIRGGAETIITYDNAGRKKTMTDADMGFWQYTYDALGNLDTQTDARGCVLNLDYDNLNRLTSKNSSGSCGTQVSTSYYYDSDNPATTSTYDPQTTNQYGFRTAMTDASGSTSWLYDNRGRMTKETKVMDSQSFETSYGYNSADLMTWMKYPDTEIVNFTYNNRMLLETLTGDNKTPSNTADDYQYLKATIYDVAGRIDTRTLGNDIVQDYNYYAWDAKVSVNGELIGQGGRLKSLSTGSLQNLTYTYDKAGNITDLVNSIASETNMYGYDELHRLTSWNLNGAIENYSYDSAGNLDIKAGVDLNYNDTSHKHAVTHIGSTQKYWYDANGNQTTRVIGTDTFNLIYDAENRLIEVKKNTVTIAQFIFDGDGRRVKSIIGSDTTLFIGGHYEVKNPGASQEITKYYFAGASRIAMRKYTVPVSMNVEYSLSDHLGSTSITTDNTGTKVSEMRYKPWGEVRYSWTATQVTTPSYALSQYTFTGQYSYMDDPSTTTVTEGFGLMFYNARWYDPSLGRFAQADTIVPGGVQGLDRYAYVNNSPINYTDPSGHNPQCGPDGIYCAGGKLKSPVRPTYVNPKNLTNAGKNGYSVYLDLFYDVGGWWWDHSGLGGDGNFTLQDFITVAVNEELAGYATSPNFSAWQEAWVRSFYTWKSEMNRHHPSGNYTSSTNAALLNFVYAQTGPKTRTKSEHFDGGFDISTGITLSANVLKSMINPSTFGHSEWADGCVVNAPCRMGSYTPGVNDPSLSYIQDFINAGCQPSFLVDPKCSADNAFVFFLDLADSYHWDQYR